MVQIPLRCRQAGAHPPAVVEAAQSRVGPGAVCSRWFGSALGLAQMLVNQEKVRRLGSPPHGVKGFRVFGFRVSGFRGPHGFRGFNFPFPTLSLLMMQRWGWAGRGNN